MYVRNTPNAMSGSAAAIASCVQRRSTSGSNVHVHRMHAVRYVPRLTELSSGPRARPKWMPRFGSAMYRGKHERPP